MKRTKKLLIGFIICMALVGGISISQGVQAAEDDFIIADELLSEDSISDSAIQDEDSDIENDSLVEDETLSQNDVDDSVIQDRAADSDFVVEDGALTKYTGNGGSVTIPSGITKIDFGAFFDCTSLTDITIPSSVTNIDGFWGCTNLKRIDVEKGNPIYSSEDGIVYNKNKTILMIYPMGKTGDFTIPSIVTEIGDSAFSQCENLTNIVIPDNITKIGKSAFYCCINLTTITIPSSVTEIGECAFAGCENLEELTILNPKTELAYNINDYSILDYGDGWTQFKNPVVIIKGYKGSTAEELFNHHNCEGTPFKFVALDEDNPTENDFVIENGILTKYNGSGGDVVIPDGVTEIGCGVFLYHSDLTSVTIPLSVTTIGDYAFCCNLTSLTIPNGVTSIGYGAFSSSSLKSITLPKSVTNIEIYAFGDCYDLKEINVDSDNAVYSSENGILYDKAKSTLVSCPGGKTDKVTIPNSVTSIEEGAFAGCRSLSEITIPDSVTSIGNGAFYMCNNLASITIPQNITSINKRVFESCDSLKSVIIPKGVTSIGDYAFWQCKNLITVTIPEGVTSIGGGAFEACDNMKTVTIPKSVTSIGVNAFSHYGNSQPITDVYYQGSKEEWGKVEQSEYGTGLEKATIHFNSPKPDNPQKPTKPKTPNKGTTLKSKNVTYKVTKKGSEVAFTKISSVSTSVSIPNTVKIDGISYKVTSVSANAFKGNKKLSKVTIGANITSIGKNAFNGCKNLKTITIKSTKLKSVGQNAFKGIKSTARIKAPTQKLKAYKRLLKDKGQGKKVKITK